MIWDGGVGGGGGGGGPGGEVRGWRLDQFHVVGREHSKVAVGAVAPPPALVDHLDPRDDVIGIEGDLRVVRCRREPSSSPSYLFLLDFIYHASTHHCVLLSF